MKNFHFSLVATLLLVVAVPVTQSQAGCWCGIEYCIGWNDPLVVDDSKTDFYETENTVTTSSQSIGSCPAAGHTPPEKECSVNGASTTVKEWEVTGSLNFSYFGVSAQASGSVTKTLGTGCTTKIDNWCQCCYQRAYEKYEHTYKEGLCWCISPLCIFGSTYSATNKVFKGLHCTDEPQCTVPADCSVDCPDGGGA